MLEGKRQVQFSINVNQWEQNGNDKKFIIKNITDGGGESVKISWEYGNCEKVNVMLAFIKN